MSQVLAETDGRLARSARTRTASMVARVIPTRDNPGVHVSWSVPTTSPPSTATASTCRGSPSTSSNAAA